MVIVCPQCGTPRGASLAPCAKCHHQPQLVDGFFAWSPALALEGSGFKSDYFAPLAAAEEKSFWFNGRNTLLIWALKTYCPNLQDFLEIGCGTGFVLKGIREAFPTARLAGSEVFCSGLKFAKRRVPDATLIQMDGRRMPYAAAFDAIGAFDVLEHIDDDRLVLENIRRALRPGGALVVTVPQHPALWSQADTYACHERRYERTEMARKVRDCGFTILRNTSFVSLLLPLLAVSRLRAARGPYDPMAEMRMPAGLNAALAIVMELEFQLIRSGINFPAGGSRLIVAIADR